MQVTETVHMHGHLLDSGILSKVLDDIREYGGDYVINRFDVGKDHEDESKVWLQVGTNEDLQLQRLLMRLQTHGVNLVDHEDVLIRTADRDGVFPDDFYSTTNLDTLIRYEGRWIPVENPEMDCGLVVSGDRIRRHCPYRPGVRRQGRGADRLWRARGSRRRATDSSREVSGCVRVHELRGLQ